MIQKAESILQKTFGFDNFRLNQKEIIKSILNKQDTLVIMPTGGGKSLCYQVPALIFDGITIVISPLISLMQDQVYQLNELEIPAVYLNSSLSIDEYNYNISRISSGEVKLVYLAPETLVLDKTINLLDKMNVDCITVDEAHCISEWGHDFRPNYRLIADIKKSFHNSVCVALTATATPRVRHDIINNLELKDCKEFVSSFDRENLYIEIKEKTKPLNQIVEFLRKYSNQSGIIYCFSRRQVDELSEDLAERGFSVRPYHAGLGETERNENQRQFVNDDVQIIVATVAFGMGINKSNVRFVIHHDLPKNIESYYQEIGRAGRDGLRSHCLLLYSPRDMAKINYFIDQMSETEAITARYQLNNLVDFCKSFSCRRIPLLKYFGEYYNSNDCGMCDNCNPKGKNMIDATIPAQKLLSSILRTKENFSLDHNIDILVGNKTEDIISNNHNKLSTYSIGKEYTFSQWKQLAKYFNKKNVIGLEGSAIKVLPEGYAILKNNKRINAFLTSEKPLSIDKKLNADIDHKLFKRLKELRKSISKKTHIPPYIIFSDKTLTEMATYKPTSKPEFLKIYGMGEVKYRKYGEIFLSELKNYLGKGDPEPAKIIEPTQKKSSVVTAFEKSGSIDKVMNESKRRRSAIISMIFEYSLSNKLENYEALKDESRLNDKLKIDILGFLDRTKTKKVSDVKLRFKKADESEIKLLMAYFNSLNKRP